MNRSLLVDLPVFLTVARQGSMTRAAAALNTVQSNISSRIQRLEEELGATYWDSLDAVKRFAGEEPEVARFYPEDDDYLIDRELTVEHHDVARVRRG